MFKQAMPVITRIDILHSFPNGFYLKFVPSRDPCRGSAWTPGATHTAMAHLIRSDRLQQSRGRTRQPSQRLHSPDPNTTLCLTFKRNKNATPSVKQGSVRPPASSRLTGRVQKDRQRGRQTKRQAKRQSDRETENRQQISQQISLPTRPAETQAETQTDTSEEMQIGRQSPTV